MTVTTKKLCEIFQASAADLREAFPEQMANFVLALDKATQPVYVAPEIAQHLSDNVRETKKILKRCAQLMKDRNWAGVAYDRMTIADKDTRFIMLRQKHLGIFAKGYTHDMRAVYVFDHEIGHQVAEGGMHGPTAHFRECVADAYAFLRHVQRYGTKTAFFKRTSKAPTMVLGTSPFHYTQAVLEHVAKLAREKDLSGMSLRETADLAAQIAREHALDTARLNKISDAFASAAYTYHCEIGDKTAIIDALYKAKPEAYTLFIEQTRAAMAVYPDDADIQKAGETFLRYPPVKAHIKRMEACTMKSAA